MANRRARLQNLRGRGGGRGRRHARNRNNRNSNDYIHPYRIFGMTSQTFKNHANAKGWVERTDFMGINDMHDPPTNPNSRSGRGKKKKASVFKAFAESKCKSHLIALKNENLPEFARAIRLATPQQISAWLSTNAPVGIRLSETEVSDLQSGGFALECVVDLVVRETVGLKDRLHMTEGQWCGLLSLTDSIIRGEIKFNIGNGNAAAPHSMNNNNNNNNGNGNFGIAIGFNGNLGNGGINNNNNNNNNLAIGDVNSNPNENDVNSNTNNSNQNDNDANDNTGGIGVIFHVHRQQNEAATNFRRRERAGRGHPFVGIDCSRRLILDIEDSAIELPTHTSSLNVVYSYNENSPYFQHYDQQLLEKFLLEKHESDKLHGRIVAQKHMTQSIFTNKTMSGNWVKNVRVTGSNEYKIAGAIGEYLGLIKYVSLECDAYCANQRLMSEDSFDADYTLGEMNHCFDSKNNRLPRSRRQLEALRDRKISTKHGTSWPVRLDPVKILRNASETKRAEVLALWGKFGVLKYSHPYMVSYFPGQEAAAKELGFILEEHIDEVDITGMDDDSKEQERDNLEWLF